MRVFILRFLGITLCFLPSTFAADFTIKSGEVNNTPQTLTDPGDKGKIEEGGTLSTGPVAVSMTNTDQKLFNEGEILTSGLGAHGVLHSGSNGSIKNKGSITTSGDVSNGIRNEGFDLKIENSGSITTSGLASDGIENLGTLVKIKNSGSITTSNVGSEGVENFGDDVVIKNSGSITTTGGSEGIFNSGSDVRIKNSGTFETTGNGIDNIGTEVKIKNSGSITTSEGSSDGIENSGAFTQIENSGSITTSEVTSDGIENTGHNVTIKSSGSIKTSGASSNGIDSSGVAVTIKNSGSITTSAAFTNGINNTGDAAQIKNSGTITTTRDGIFNNGTGSSIKNSGTISTSGGSGDGIDNLASAVFIKNSGSITTSGIASDGIDNGGSSVIIKNSGSITTTGNSDGIDNRGSSVIIKNSGSITASAEGVAGILTSGSNIKIINSGKVCVSAANSDGIRVNSPANVQIINSGTIKSEQGFAIFFNASPSSLTLKRGSNIQGLVESPQLLNLRVQKGLNLFLTLTDASAGFQIIEIDDPFVLSGTNTIAVIDRTGLAMQEDVAQDLSDNIFAGVKSSYCNCHCGLWTETIGSYRHRDKRSKTVCFSDWQVGQLLGYHTNFCEGSLNLFGGLLFGEAEVHKDTQHACTKTYLGGASYSKCLCDICVGVTVAGGCVDWENERIVQNNLAEKGKEKAKFDEIALFATTELFLSHGFGCTQADFSLRYMGFFLGDYQEKGSSANLKVKDRDIHFLQARLDVSLPSRLRTNCFCFVPYLGVYDRYQICNEKIDACLLDQEIKFNTGNPENLAALLVGIKMFNRSAAQFDFHFNVEADYDTSKSSRVLGCMGLSF